MEIGGDRNFLSFREKYSKYTDFSDYSGTFLTIKKRSGIIPGGFDSPGTTFVKNYDVPTLDKIR